MKMPDTNSSFSDLIKARNHFIYRSDDLAIDLKNASWYSIERSHLCDTQIEISFFGRRMSFPYTRELEQSLKDLFQLKSEGRL
jgi:hypothetical protein